MINWREMVLKRPLTGVVTREVSKEQKSGFNSECSTAFVVPFGVTYEKIGMIQRRLAWPLHKDDTLSRSGRPTGLNIYFSVSASIGSGILPTLWLRATKVRILIE